VLPSISRDVGDELAQGGDRVVLGEASPRRPAGTATAGGRPGPERGSMGLITFCVTVGRAQELACAVQYAGYPSVITEISDDKTRFCVYSSQHDVLALGPVVRYSSRCFDAIRSAF